MKLLLIYLILSFTMNAQSIAIYQDAKFLVSRDTHGNKAGTLDLLLRFKMEGKQQRRGYMIIYPEYEQASLKGGKYVRYGVGLGYCFNRLGGFETTFSGGWGWIDRDGTRHSGHFSGELGYRIRNFKLNLLGQLTDRTDLKYPQWRFSGFIGLEYKLPL